MGAQGGLRGETQASIHPVFQERLEELQEQAGANAAAARGDGQAAWDLPTDLATDLFDIKALHTPAHDRDDINTNFARLVSSPDTAGTTGDVIALTYQNDYVASEERALRLRHCNLVRSVAHATARRYALGAGRTFTNIREQAEEMIRVGGAAR